MQEHRAIKMNEKYQTAFAFELEGVEFLSPYSTPTQPVFLPCAHLSKGDGFLLRNVFFSPSANVRLERELIYDSQFDERPRGRKKRSFFNENEHQRLGGKKKVRVRGREGRRERENDS